MDDHEQGLPPCDIVAERSVIGSILIDESCLDSIAILVQPEDFYRTAHGTIFEALVAMRHDGVGIDPVTLATRLSSNGHAAEFFGQDVAAMLDNMVMLTPTATHASDYAATVHETAVKRRMISFAQHMKTAAHGPANSAETLASMRLQLDHLTKAQASTITIHWAVETIAGESPVDWVIEGMLASRSVGVFYGDPGAKKTWVSCDLAYHVATGTPWLGRKVKRGTVLMLDEESGNNRLTNRMAAARRGDDLPADVPVGWTNHLGWNFRSPQSVLKLRTEVLDKVKPTLIIIDAMADVTGGADENSAAEMAPIMAQLRSIAEDYDCAVIILHHCNKVGGYRGSTAIAGAVDLMLLFESKNGDTTITLTATKNRDGEPFTFTACATWLRSFEVDNSEFKLALAQPTKRVEFYTGAEGYIIDYLTDHGESTMADITSHPLGCTAGTAKHTMYELEKRGKICRVDGGGQGRVGTWKLVEE